jgi:hypothetical protein
MNPASEVDTTPKPDFPDCNTCANQGKVTLLRIHCKEVNFPTIRWHPVQKKAKSVAFITLP